MRKTKEQPHQHVLAYHGSGVAIDRFDFAYTGIGNDQYGAGFYFTTDPDEARAYCFARIDDLTKPGGEHSPTVHCARLHLDRPLPVDLRADLTPAQARRFIQSSPNLDSVLADWADLESEGRQTALNNAIASYSCATGGDGPSPLIEILNSLANDFFVGSVPAFNQAVREILGYDSVVARHDNGHLHYVVFFPEQIEVIEQVAVDNLEADPSRSCVR
jgi:hypothetical protein